jgi:putative addiction module CopG family antidote
LTASISVIFRWMAPTPNPNAASNVRAYIVDTGIRITHQDFGGRAVWGTNATGDGVDDDCHGHGPHVAGTVGGAAHGVAKGVACVAARTGHCARVTLAIFANQASLDVGTMNISLPDSLKAFVEEQVAAKGYGTSSEYMRELIRKDQDRQHLRNLLLEGAQSVPLD